MKIVIEVERFLENCTFEVGSGDKTININIKSLLQGMVVKCDNPDSVALFERTLSGALQKIIVDALDAAKDDQKVEL